MNHSMEVKILWRTRSQGLRANRKVGTARNRLKEAGSETASRRTEIGYEALITVPDEAVTVMASLDGVPAPMKDGDAVEKRAATASRRQIAKGPAGYREVGCATLFF